MNRKSCFNIFCMSLCFFLTAIVFTLDLQGQSISYEAEYTFQGAFSAIASAGDVNNDGFDDMITGAPNDGTNGQVRLFSGATGSVLRSITPLFFGASFGSSVGSIGDVNRDGVPDFAVGDDFENTTPLGALATRGTVRVYSGSSGLLLYTADNAGTGFGTSLGKVGDLNNDNVPDFIVGGSSSAAVVSGSDGSTLQSFEPFGSEDGFGTAVSGIDDVDGDMVPDLVISAPFYPRTGFFSSNGPGRVAVYSGATGDIIHTFDGDGPRDAFGQTLGSAGDINGDGVTDIIVGAPGDSIFSGSGYARVFSGADGSVLLSIEGPRRLGASVASIGDANGDGTPDLLIGAPGSGVVAPGSALIYSGSDGSLIDEIFGSSDGDLFGSEVASAGDVNGDGQQDFIVTAFFGDYARVFTSTATVSVLGDVETVSIGSRYEYGWSRKLF